MQTEDRFVKDKEFKFQKVPAAKAFKMFTRLSKILNKGVKKWKEEGLSVDDKTFTKPEVIVPLLTDILASVEDSDLDLLTSWLRDYVRVRVDDQIKADLKSVGKDAGEGDFAYLSEANVFEAAFCGRLDLQFMVILEFIKLNFLDSLLGMADKLK